MPVWSTKRLIKKTACIFCILCCIILYSEKANGADERVRHRGGKAPSPFSENRALLDLLGPDASLSFRRDGFAVFQLENETGNGIVTMYDAFPGIRLFYNDLHMSYITDHDDMPIQTYMREYRLQAAAVMLRETGDAIADIAAKTGYDSHARFSFAFKSVFGASPTDYRKVFVQKR
jgi:hypothetical protein